MQRYYVLTINGDDDVIIHPSIEFMYYFKTDNTDRVLKILDDVLCTTSCIAGKESYFGEWIETVNSVIGHVKSEGMKEFSEGGNMYISIEVRSYPEEWEWDD